MRAPARLPSSPWNSLMKEWICCRRAQWRLPLPTPSAMPWAARSVFRCEEDAMPVEINTLTSHVNVADTALPESVLEKIVAVVLARLHDAQTARELEKREQEIRPHM